MRRSRTLVYNREGLSQRGPKCLNGFGPKVSDLNLALPSFSKKCLFFGGGPAGSTICLNCRFRPSEAPKMSENHYQASCELYRASGCISRTLFSIYRLPYTCSYHSTVRIRPITMQPCFSSLIVPLPSLASLLMHLAVYIPPSLAPSILSPWCYLSLQVLTGGP